MTMTNAERQQRWRDRRAAERAAALAPVPDAPPRDPDELLLPAVEVSVAALGLGERDQAAVQLARVLASAIDTAADQAVALRVLGPQLAKALEAVGGTPASRSRLPGKPPQRSAPNRVAALRASHAKTKARYGRA